VDIRDLDPGDDPGAPPDLSVRAFGPLAALRRAGLAAGGAPDGDAALDGASGADAFMLGFI
jgi:hypothetical protein